MPCCRGLQSIIAVCFHTGLNAGQPAAIVLCVSGLWQVQERHDSATALRTVVLLCLILQDLLSDRSRVLRLVLDEARAVAAKHGQPRRSRILVSVPMWLPNSLGCAILLWHVLCSSTQSTPSAGMCAHGSCWSTAATTDGITAEAAWS
jgi:hypothetical protein